MRARHFLAPAMVVAVAVACAAPSDREPVDASGATSHGSVSTAAAHAQWMLDEALGPGPITPDDLAGRFAANLGASELASLTATIETVRATGPWTARAVRTDNGGHTAETVLESAAGTHLLMHTTVDTDGRAILFWFGAAIDPDLDLTSADSRARALEAIPAQSALAVGRVDGGRCTDLVIEGTAPETSLPLASVSKLLVVEAVLDRVRAGTLGWDQTLVVEERHRSLRPGESAGLELGDTMTVADAVQRLLVHSDNTATDLLVDTVGAASMEHAYSAAAPGSTSPFWSTREVFALGWGRDAVAGPLPAAAPELHDLRSTVAARPLATTTFDVTSSRWQDGLDWFLTPAQACDLGARLNARWDELPAQVKEATADGRLLLRKPGGVPGVVSGLWIVEGASGTHVVTVQLAATDHTTLADAPGLMALGDALAEQAAS